MWEIYQENLKRNSNYPHIGMRNPKIEGRPYEWKTYREIYNLMEIFARGIYFHIFYNFKVCSHLIYAKRFMMKKKIGDFWVCIQGIGKNGPL